MSIIWGIVYGVRQGLNYTGIKGISVILPSLMEQERIVSTISHKISKIDRLINNMESQIEKLKQYKQSLITEVVTKGLDPDAEMRDSGVELINAIPKNWEVKKYKYVAKIKSNLVDPSEYMKFPQVSPDCIEKNSCKLIKYQTVEEVGIESNNHLFYKGQIVYSKVRPLLGKVIIAPFDGLCSADMYPIETSENPKFVVFMMLSSYFSKQVKLITENRVKMPKINQEELASITVVLPKYEEQEMIANYLSEKCAAVDDLIEIKYKKIDKLTQYKKSLIYEYVTGKKEVG